jgi:endoglycosylceramidase
MKMRALAALAALAAATATMNDSAAH